VVPVIHRRRGSGRGDRVADSPIVLRWSCLALSHDGGCNRGSANRPGRIACRRNCSTGAQPDGCMEKVAGFLETFFAVRRKSFEQSDDSRPPPCSWNRGLGRKSQPMAGSTGADGDGCSRLLTAFDDSPMSTGGRQSQGSFAHFVPSNPAKLKMGSLTNIARGVANIVRSVDSVLAASA
jgi:hypothetical protein